MVQAKCRNMEFAEKEFALTHMLQALNEVGALEGVVFKGGTCIRKTLSGPSARLSTDLDFTSLSLSRAPDDLVLAFHEISVAFSNSAFHGFTFHMGLEGGTDWYSSGTGESVGFGIHYAHSNMGLDGEIRVQVSMRALPILAPVQSRQIEQQYFNTLEFEPCGLLRLRAEEMLAEKVRALCQREKTRDLYDLNWFSTFPHDHEVIRKLVVLKMQESRESFEPERFFSRLSPETRWDWDDLASLVKDIDKREGAKMLKTCREAFLFLDDLSPEELAVARDPYARQGALAKSLSEAVVARAGDREDRHWERAAGRGVTRSP